MLNNADEVLRDLARARLDLGGAEDLEPGSRVATTKAASRMKVRHSSERGHNLIAAGRRARRRSRYPHTVWM